MSSITMRCSAASRMNGNVQLESGGRSLVEEIEYAENSTFKYYSGYEELDVGASDVFTSAEYNWKAGGHGRRNFRP